MPQSSAWRLLRWTLRALTRSMIASRDNSGNTIETTIVAVVINDGTFTGTVAGPFVAILILIGEVDVL